MLFLWRLIKGYVYFECNGGFVERFINLCASHKVNVWNLKGHDKTISGFVSKKQSAQLPDFAQRVGTELQFGEAHGLPAFFQNNKSRVGLLIGIVLILMIINIFGMFTWTVEINGVHSLSEASLYSQLEKVGIHSGMFKPAIDQYEKKQLILKNIDGIAWASVNINGTVLTVEMSESEKKPKIVDVQVPCNIKAEKSGQIKRIGTKAGTCECAVGDAVVEGQVLISGIIEDKYGDLSIVHADGAIIADTEYRLQTTVPLSYNINLPKKAQYSRKMADLMGVRFTYQFASSPATNYFTKRRHDSFFFEKNRIPLSITTENLYSLTNKTVNLSQKQAKAIAQKLMILEKLFALNDKEITNVSFEYEVQDNCMILSGIYSCVEDIGYSEDIQIEENTELFDGVPDTNKEEQSSDSQ
ncbi:MAG: sporulation protein YqfD [Clostridia bacterium]|nr:sporulation protein YqfD [Clostridia bacterium]